MAYSINNKEITPESLFKKSYTRDVQLIIIEHFKTIKIKIKEASNAGRNEIYYDLPDADSLVAGQLEPEDIQLIVYSDLIEKVEELGLKVGLIVDEKNNSLLHVRWPSSLDPVEKNRRKKIIIKHMEKFEN